MTQSVSFLGKGWAFPMDPTTAGGAEAQEDDKVRQSIWMILATAPGERVMRPDFGCGINGLVFANFNDATVGQVLNEVSVALATWEPRIDVLGVDVAPDANEPNVVLISIDYRIRSTNSRYNLVYPFFTS